MLREIMVQEIIDLKLQGFSINEIIEYYEKGSGKAPSRPTIRKYYDMNTVPDISANMAKDKAFVMRIFMNQNIYFSAQKTMYMKPINTVSSGLA